MAHIDILMVADAEGILKQYGQPGLTSAPTTGPGSLQQPQVVDGSFVFFITKKGDALANNGNWQLDVSTGTETESAVDIIRWRWIALDLGHKFDCPITGFDFSPSSAGKVETPLLRHYSTTLVVTDPTDATKPVVQKGIDRCWESRAVRDGTIGYNVMFMVVDQEGTVRIHTQIDPYFLIHG